MAGDDHAGLANATAPVLPGAAWQRCRAHYHRNLLTRVPKSARPWVPTLARTIFEQPDAASVRAQHAQVARALEAKLPQAAARLDEARDDILAFAPFPREVWRQIWSSNPRERLNKEIRRRTDVVGVFRTAAPSSGSSARCWPSRTTNGPNRAATWGRKYSPRAGKPPRGKKETLLKLTVIRN